MPASFSRVCDSQRISGFWIPVVVERDTFDAQVDVAIVRMGSAASCGADPAGRRTSLAIGKTLVVGRDFETLAVTTNVKLTHMNTSRDPV